jgi:hypothetical protein
MEPFGRVVRSFARTFLCRRWVARRVVASSGAQIGVRENLQRVRFARADDWIRNGINWGEIMQIDRVHTNRFIAFAGFTLCFLFLLAIIAFAFS